MKTLSSSMESRRGFALVITMSLMVLLLVLAVGLLSLSAVTLRTSSLTDPQRVAQANARLGLMLAIGELQKAAGKDQRITGTADLAGTAAGERISDGASPGNNNSVNGVSKGLSGVQAGTRHWTGVWENHLLQSSGDPITKIFTETPSPQLVQWLVSGNENTTSPRFTPGSNGISVGAGGTAGDSKKAVVLVGENTVGSPSGDALEDYVVAPLVKIESETAPGAYAWWVGDEGVKAKFNIVAPYAAGAVATSESMAAQRRGWETVEGFESYPLPGADKALNGILTTGQAALVNASFNSGTPTHLNKVFHAATMDSFGVLSDVLQGGLRTDLTPLLASALSSSPSAPIANSPQKGGNIIPSAFSPERGPKWDRIKELTDRRKNLTGGGLSVRVPSAATEETEPIIGPTMVDFRLLLGAKVVKPPTGVTGFYVFPLAKIAVAIANPYSYPLRWESPLKLQIKYADEGKRSRRSTRIWNLNFDSNYIAGSSSPSVLSGTTFEIPSGSLPAGEARTYTMATPVLKQAVPLRPGTATVVLSPYNDAIGSDLKASVILEDRLKAYTDPSISMDIREEANTTPINIELSYNNQILRKFERFELDNPEFDPTKIVFNFATMTYMLDKPFSLQLYGLQLSQPGIKYGTLFTNPSDFGIRSSTLRTFADFNMQGAYFRKPIISYNPPPYFMTIATQRGDLTFDADGGTGAAFTRNLSASLPWGRGPASNNSAKTVLFSAPETFTSLAQLQHADLTADNRYVSVAHQPGNAFGNSYATPFVQRNLTSQSRNDYSVINDSSSSSESTKYFDISYLLNASIWDSYFLSTLRGKEPLNKQMVNFYSRDDSSSLLTSATGAASRLMLDGGFNVNSTSKSAWKAFLGSSKYLKHPMDNNSSSDAFFPRSLEQPAGNVNPPSGNGEDSFAGYRRLDDKQLDLLADEITSQVRLRGPFVSLAHFVNRALVGITANNKELGRSGALQSAIDNCGVNITPDGGTSIFSSISSAPERENERLRLHKNGTAGAADFSGSKPTQLSEAVWPKTSRDGNPGSVASIYADPEILDNGAEQGMRSTGIPGWLTQADILQVIGPSIAVRSDTFRIRSYGESTDSKGNILAKAWCEAIVQRTPQYVDSNNADTDRGNGLSRTNQNLGRKFKMISFRWLSPYEI